MTKSREIRLLGIAGSPGISIGRAYLLDGGDVTVIDRYYIEPGDIDSEVLRFKKAVHDARQELSQIIASLPDNMKEHLYILEAHLLLHKDKMLYEKTIEIIGSQQVNAEWALRKSVDNAKALFSEITDPYLKSRITDIEHVADRILRRLAGLPGPVFHEIKKGMILVASDLSPSETSQIQKDRVMGFITDKGGKTSHTSILARSMGIPAICGVEKATRLIEPDDILIIDGYRGIVIIRPRKQTIKQYETLLKRYEAQYEKVLKSVALPAVSRDGKRFSVMANIELPGEVDKAKVNGADGIGLFRTEILYLARGTFPEEDVLYEEYKKVIEEMSPAPVTIRTLDINGDKAVSPSTAPDEPNPALGLRAIRFCLNNPDIFRIQLRAILRAAKHGNARLLLPMIGSKDELDAARAAIVEACKSLADDGIEHAADIPVGVMIEVPSAAIIADILARESDFFSIGTNDLIQYTLAIDRTNRLVDYLFDPFHPAVLRLIKQVVDAGNRAGIPTFMCGEMAGDPLALPVLIGLGITELSMVPSTIPHIKQMIRNINEDDARALAEEVLAQRTSEHVVERIKQRFGDTLSMIDDPKTSH